uniref:Variant erythrocyte surface antigen-1 family protein n=1 Tax=Babesia bovis TaxID=5865 RepID=A7ANW9_BABBO|eukprot:XP_001611821.1 variant erythrocyte surface antigen-1 family protein [Babesia bovis T2Bo]
MSKNNQTCSASGGDKKCLTVCPTNVKEAIDWFICLTGNDDSPDDCVKKVASDVWDILFKAPRSGDTTVKWCWEECDIINNTDLIKNNEKAVSYVKALIDGLGKKLASFIGCINCTKTSCPHCTKGVACGLFDGSYTYCYSSASACCITSKEKEHKRCAKILLGCIPLIFSSLTYLFWNCCDNANAGKWKDCDITAGSKNSLCAYLTTLGYDTKHLNNCKGSQIKTLLCGFSELSDCLTDKKSTELTGDKPKSYAEFVNAIQNSFTSNGQGEQAGTSDDQEKGKQVPLQRLYSGASFYFQATQEKCNQKLDKANRPKTICELLYWLLGLPYTPVGMRVENGLLEVLLDQEDEVNEEDKGCGYLPSGKCCKPPSTDESPCVLTLGTADYYLLPPCYYAAFVLLSIEGKLVSGKKDNAQPASSSGDSGSQQSSPSGKNDNQTSEPFLHDVYANRHFEFYYPSSERSWFAMVWDVVYALYFQLGFLYKQCNVDYKTGYGWKDCKYGKDVKSYESKTWICKPSQPKGPHNDQCGQAPSDYSPLQGYLCDKLTDFICEKNGEESQSESDSKSYCAHLDHRPPSQWCPIPMGFGDDLKNLTSQRKGEDLSEILSLYFEDKIRGSSLYQLMLYLGFVSLRPPRCLGDMFAFLCGIGRLCDANPPPKDGTLEKLWGDKISWYPGAPNLENFTTALKILAGSCTKPDPSKDTSVSLCSLSPPDESKCNSCTKYLCSISWSVYTVFSTRHIESYLSWVVYLIDDFKSNLEAFLNHLQSVECKSGCSECSNIQKCHKQNSTGGCQCKVVECKRILGALYRFGFTYQDISALKNDKKCSDFLKQLKDVAEGGPLKNLIKAVNQMLYSIRLAFIFWAWLLWTAAIVYLVFGLVIDLDILHIRSHIWLKHTHNIPAFNLFAARRLKYGIQVYFGR